MTNARWLDRRETVLSLSMAGFALAIFALTRGRSGEYTGMIELFWIGTLVAMVPLWLSVWSSTSRTWTAFLVVVVGVGLYCLKLFRSPTSFVYYDEQGFIRAARDLVEGVGLFQPNPLIPIARSYPGLQAAAGADALVAGVEPFVAGALLAGFLHIVTPVLIMAVGEHVSGSFRAGGIAALIYASNPSFIYFDSQFAYETLGLPLLLAGLLCYLRWRGDLGRSWMLLAFLFATSLAVTHPLTLLALIAILAVFMALDTIADDRLMAGTAMLFIYAFAIATLWVAVVAPYTLDYLLPHVGDVSTAASELVDRLLTGQSPPRPLFVADPIPLYERAAAISAAVIWTVLAVFVAVRAFRTSRIELRAMAFVGLVIVATAPLVFTDSAEGAKRLWAIDFIGLAVAGGTVLGAGLPTGRRLPVRAGIVGMSTILVLGGAVASSGEHIRFPGPFQIEADPRSLTTDTLDAAAWLDRTAEGGARLFADRTGSMATGASHDLFPDTHSFDGSMPWRVFFGAEVDSAVIDQLSRYRIRYLFVDRRMAQFVPRIGVYFEGGERRDLKYTAKVPPSIKALDKFTDDARFARIYDNGSIVIYAVDASLAP